LPLRI